jgi:hypothetical protein
MTYFLFTDHDVWHREIIADTWRAALCKARAEFGIGGRLRICCVNYEARDYHLDGTSYTFTLRKVN